MVKKALIPVLLIAGLLFLVSSAFSAPNPLDCSGYPEPRVFLESQSWHQEPDGKIFSVQLATCFPLLQTISGPTVHFDVRGRLTGNPGIVKGLRVQIFKNGADPTLLVPLNWSCTTDCEQWFSIDVPLSKLL